MNDAPSAVSLPNISGTVIAVRERVITVQYPPSAAPHPLMTHTTPAGHVVTLVRRAGEGLVEGLVAPGTAFTVGMVLSPAQAMTAGPLTTEALGEAVAALSSPPAADAPLFETGIKMIDVFCPLLAGSRVALYGPVNVGKLVMITEMQHRHGAGTLSATLFHLVLPADIPGVHAIFAREPAADGGGPGPITVAHLCTTTAVPASAEADLFDAHLVFTQEYAKDWVKPAIDPLLSGSKALTVVHVGARHLAIVEEGRELFARAAAINASGRPFDALSAKEQAIMGRARRLRFFLTNPFFTTAPYTKWPGRIVSRADALDGCAAILSGAYDHLPVQAFFMIGDITEAEEKARTLAKG